MIINDIYEDAREVLGYCEQDKVFSRLTDAIETLANKGAWEPLLAYLSIGTVDGMFIDLPDTVEVPLRINLDDNPAFPRDKLYQFTVNGPAYAGARVDWSWEDMGEMASVNPDTGLWWPGVGRRRIRISKSGVAVFMLVRMKTVKVTALSQFVPLHNKMAILLMLKALECFRRGTPQDFQLGQGQEAQALKFLQEEQQSRSIYADISKAIDTPTIIGYAYHANNMIVVADIYDEVSQIVGGIGQQHVFDRISEAVEVLANKGQWDGITSYLDVSLDGKDKFGLPRQVEIPLRININSKPSVPRGRLFEFTTNGPGTDFSEVTTLTWEDLGNSPVQIALDVPSPLSVGGNDVDMGKHVTVYGTSPTGVEVQATYTIPANTAPSPAKFIDPDVPIPEPPQGGGSAPIVFRDITRIVKDLTTAPVGVFGNYKLLALMYPDDVEPMFRQIKLNRPAKEVKIMYRKASMKITSVNDIIPLKSRSAILCMVRSLQLLKTPALEGGAFQLAQALEAQALKYLQEEEQSRLAYIEASAKDVLPALGINTSSNGVVIAGDVYDDAADIFGAIGRQRLFDKITESMEMLANKSQWDGLDGYVDINADGKGYISLPRKVEVPIGMNFCEAPAQMRNKWYEFHMNGMGTLSNQGGTSGFFDDLGEYPLIVEPYQPLQIFAKTSWQPDNTANVIAYGYNTTGTWIKSVDSTGKVMDGEIVPVVYVDPSNTDLTISISATKNYFRQINRITKDETQSTMLLFGVVPTPPPTNGHSTPPPVLLSMFDGDETEPMFRRIRVPKEAQWARLRYRTRTMKITKMSDPLNMRSKTALVTMMRSLKALETGQVDAANAFEAKAIQLISEEQMSRNPGQTFDLQFDQATCFADPLQGVY
jgi:hypothetical protein